MGIAEGAGGPRLVVYLSERIPARQRESLPRTWQGLPVEVRELGKVIPASPSRRGITVPSPSWSSSSLTESVVEQAALAWLESAGWSVKNGAEIAPGEPAAERDDYGQVVLAQRLRDALARLNPALPAEALDGRLPKAHAPRRPDVGGAQPCRASLVRGRGDGRVPDAGWLHPRRAGAGDRLRRCRQQRLARRQPVHRQREQAHAASGRGAVRQRPAAGAHRAEERRRRERHDLDRLPTAPDVQGRGPLALRLQRSAGRLRRRRGAGRHVYGRAGMVQALAHRSRASAWQTRTCRSFRSCSKACSRSVGSST